MIVLYIVHNWRRFWQAMATDVFRFPSGTCTRFLSFRGLSILTTRGFSFFQLAPSRFQGFTVVIDPSMAFFSGRGWSACDMAAFSPSLVGINLMIFYVQPFTPMIPGHLLLF